jgi:hypothetical protein
MKNNHLDIAPIIPNKSAAGIKLRTTKKTLKKHYGNPVEIDKQSTFEIWIYKNVSFWLESGKVTQIRISNLYEGKTKEGISLGSTKSEVITAYGELRWEGTWYIQSPPFGIGFDFGINFFGEKHVIDIYIFEQ